MVIINDHRLASEILDKHSAINSSRPRRVFANELAGFGKEISTLDNTSLLQAYHRAMARTLGSRDAVSKFDGILEVESRRFLWRLLHSPQDFVNHTQKFARAFILKSTYDYTIDPHEDDLFVDLADRALQNFSKATAPGAWLVDLIPALKPVPKWVPGTGFKKTARHYAGSMRQFAHGGYSFFLTLVLQYRYQHSFASQLLAEPEDREILEWASAGLYLAGVDPTVSALQAFHLAMILNPEVQQKAQAEIDRVLGERVLPSVADRSNLPYIDAIVTEILRWHTVAPLSIPHRAEEDHVINGYLIPKDALLLPNIWAYNHNPEIYPEPSEFKPERFIPSEGIDAAPDPRNVAFGFGQRRCPGHLLADTTLFITMASILAVFDLSKPRGADGKFIEPQVDFTPGLISHPQPFECVFTPRTPGHKDLVLEFLRQNPFEQSDREILVQADLPWCCTYQV
ncbi:cytochrome P450 [Penicillium paradoxum]|uniref:cytochrome P450 n=1 Tax=Penicillium paradoxum TaxID=176176 RepID=UPI0025497CD4|nr:cytochrome P450 [Penicillium paradoxum]KAJ5788307.1 cytochrome P450 [Penicillium paradoxum]